MKKLLAKSLATLAAFVALPAAAGWATYPGSVCVPRAGSQDLIYFFSGRAITEARDPVWAGRTEELIAQAVNHTGPGTRLARAECRANLCRVELLHEGAEARTRTVEGLLTTPGLKGETVVRHIQQGDKLVSLVYVAREGTRLPPFRK